MISREEISATLNGTTWVEVKLFAGSGYLTEIWLKVPSDIGVGTNVLVGLFNASYLTDGDERYNSGNLAENGNHLLDFITASATDFPMRLAYTRGDKLMIKADGAATKAVEFVISLEE